MTPNDPVPWTIIDPLLRRLYEYWNDERGGQPMPARKDIDPIKMPYILGHVMLMDVLDKPGRFRVRLQGTELGWWIGSDLTGKMLEALQPAQMQALMRDYLTAVIETREPSHKLGRIVFDGLERYFEALVLPLSTQRNSVDVILMAVRRRCNRHAGAGGAAETP